MIVSMEDKNRQIKCVVWDLENRRRGMSAVPETPLEVWGNAKVEQRFLDAGVGSWEELSIRYHRIKPWERIPLPPAPEGECFMYFDRPAYNFSAMVRQAHHDNLDFN